MWINAAFLGPFYVDQCCDIIPIYEIMNHFEIGYSEYLFPYKWFTYTIYVCMV